MYEDDEILEADIFQKDFTKKIKFFAAVKAKDDAYIDLYFKSHDKYYDLTFYNNYPETPFIELNEYDDVNDLNFHQNAECKYYKIDKKNQTLKFLKKDVNEISSNLFRLSLIGKDIDDIINNGASNLEIDDKFMIKEEDYIDIRKELLSFDNAKSIER